MSIKFLCLYCILLIVAIICGTKYIGYVISIVKGATKLSLSKKENINNYLKNILLIFVFSFVISVTFNYISFIFENYEKTIEINEYDFYKSSSFINENDVFNIDGYNIISFVYINNKIPTTIKLTRNEFNEIKQIYEDCNVPYLIIEKKQKENWPFKFIKTFYTIVYPTDFLK